VNPRRKEITTYDVTVVSDRSYENMRAGQQRYAVVEFCAKAETAWAKIASGKYDWLGMKRSTFIFGRPPAGSGFGSGALTVGTPRAPSCLGNDRIERFGRLGRFEVDTPH
jgi:hypothetical protein